MLNNHRENLRRAYDKYARDRDGASREDWKMEERLKFLELLQQEHKQDLLEVGAGHGLDSQFFQSQGLKVTCVDLAPGMVELCRQKGLNAQVMDMADLSFPDGSFDGIYSMNSLLHLGKQELPAVLRRLSTLLRKGGLAYLGVYGGFAAEGIWETDGYEPKRFYSFFTDEGFEQEVSQVFDVVSFNPLYYDETGPLHFQSVIARKRSSASQR
jgi:SAM-dependent methyltransferase